MAVAGVCTPKKAGQRRRSASGCGGASPRTPTSRGGASSPRTPASGGGASPRTPASGAAAPRRHSSTPKKTKPILIAKKCSSCPRGWAPACVLRSAGKGSPLRRARTGSDTQPSSFQKKVVKKLVHMASYKTRTPPDGRLPPIPRIHIHPKAASSYKTRTPPEDRLPPIPRIHIHPKAASAKKSESEYMSSTKVVSDEPSVEDDPIAFYSPKVDHPLKNLAKGGKSYAHGKKQRHLRLRKEIDKGSLNGC